jgi:hypothetical protein
MDRAKFIGAFLISMLFLIQGLIFAWGNTWMGAGLEAIVNEARWKAGPFRYSGALQIVNAGHDSDIYYGSTLNAVPDYTFSAGPDIQVFLPLKKRIVFDISESPRYVFFLDTSHERALNNTFAGQVHFIFDRFYFQVGGGLINAKQRLSTELNLNIRRKEDSMNGLMLWQLSKGTSFALQYRRSAFNFENLTSGVANIRENLNRSESYIDFMAYLQQQAKTRFYLDGQYGSYVFAESVSRFKDSRSYAVFGGVEFLRPTAGFEGLTAGLRGTIKIGFQYLDVLDPLHKDYLGLSGKTEVFLGIMKLTALHVFFSMGPQFSAYSSRTYYVQTIYGAGLSRALSRKVLFSYNFFYGRNKYPAEEIAGGSSSGRSADRYMAHAFNLNFRLGRELELSLLANFGGRKSQLAPRPDVRRGFIGFSLTYGYLSGGLSLRPGPMS